MLQNNAEHREDWQQALKYKFWRAPIFKAILKRQLRVPRPLHVKKIAKQGANF